VCARRTAYFSMEPRDLALPLLVASIGLNQEQNKTTRENGYASFHFFRCISGEGTVEAGRQVFALKPNMGMILLPNEPHCYYPVSEPWIVDWITFDGSNAASILAYLEIDRSVAFDLPYPEITASILRTFEEMIIAQKPTLKMDISCQLYQLLISLYWNMPTSKNLSRENRYKKIEPVLHFVEQNYASPLTLELLADQAGVTPRHLCLLFREVLHMRPFWYVNTLRINNSKRLLLEHRDMNIFQVAALCGYENICYFNQTFKAIAGMSPSQFRQLH
jgi:AraC family transcriptional regulator, arabinose operon regulatory protein